MGLLSKAQGTPLTPAQQQLQQTALDSAGNFYNKWLPVQSFFINSTNANAPAQQAMERGQVASSTRTAGADATKALLSRDTATGATPGSGRYAMALQKGADATTSAVGTGLAGATADAQKRYMQALQTGLGMTQKDQSIAMQGLNTASQAQAQEAGAVQAGNQSSQQGAGQLAGLALAAF
jgi:hypothetical protein